MNARDSPTDRAKKLLSAMTTAEKVAMLHGYSGDYVGNVVANSRLGIPALTMNDGPQGFRDNARPGTSTSFPCALAVGATFDRERANEWGAAMGAEFYNKGSNVQLGPGMCVARVPVNGRNFEYISGEDPFLGYAMVQPVVQGIQAQGVIANAKHWVHNNQETNRTRSSVTIDPRTQFEMYYPPFAGAVEAGVGSVMCSYNKINGHWSCENNDTLHDLKDALGFEGWVMSDWGATHSTSILEGLDQEMPSGQFMGDALLQKVESGQVPMEAVNASVLRILVPMFAFGIMDGHNPNSISNNVTTPAHARTARAIAEDSAVLLTNLNSILPLDSDSINSIALIGPQALDPNVHGGGSGQVVPWSVSTPFWSIRERFLGSGRPASNCSGGVFEEGIDYFQANNPSQPSESVEGCCALCSARRDCQYFSYQTKTKVCYFKATNDGRRANADVTSGRCIPDVPECVSGKCLSYSADATTGAANAKNADVAIVFVETTSSEGADRRTLSLGDDQNDMISAVAKAQHNTIVVAVTPGAILTPWSDDVAAVLTFFMPGQEYGAAVARLLFGDVNPSGRLPLTFPNKDNEMNFTTSQYPGINNVATYSEKLEVGYRWYDAHNVAPAFPFGHGLSYMQTSLSNLTVNGTATEGGKIGVTLSHEGGMAGKAVVQAYLAFPKSAGEPPLQLRGFEKVMLEEKGRLRLEFQLSPRDLSMWDEDNGWTPVSGEYGVFVGLSSRNLLVNTTFTF